MPTTAETIKNLNWVTERISNRVWTVSLAVLATSLGYIIESSKNETPFIEPQLVALPAAMAFVALTFDLLQYTAANRQNLRLLRQLEASKEASIGYSTDDIWYKMRSSAYLLKIAFCFLAAGSMIWITVQESLGVIGGSS